MSSTALTKAEVTDKLHHQVGLSRQDCGELVEAILGLVTENLVKNEEVKIRSFGSFYTRHKNKRIGRNPKTGVDIEITPRRVLTFRPSILLKNRINAGANLKS